MLSIFPQDAPFKVYSYDAWYGDGWDPKAFGRPYDFSRGFFEQFRELMREVPLLTLNAQGLVNCDYVNQCGWSKNCYFTIESDSNEDCMYSFRIFNNKNCVDCTEVVRSERCYECMDCENAFMLRYCQLCRRTSDSSFCFDLRGCKYCFGCVGLRNKEYCFFNEQLAREEWMKKTALFDFCNPEHTSLALERFNALKAAHPRKFYVGEQNENVSGNYIYESKNAHHSFDVRASRDVRYCNMISRSTDCMDYYVWGDGAQKIYNSECCGHGIANLVCCCDCWEGVHDLMYCYLCVLSTSDCFGCVGLKRGKYFILNKQYTKEEYEDLVVRIIRQMGGETADTISASAQRELELTNWGEFFPAAISPYAYNESVAQDVEPLNKEQALASGLRFREQMPFSTGKETTALSKLPLDARKAPDSIVQEILACEVSGRNYRIVEQELKFYREMGLPLPHLHPDERHRQRMMMRNPPQLWQRACAQCGIAFETSYSLEREEKILCERCYLKAVY